MVAGMKCFFIGLLTLFLAVYLAFGIWMNVFAFATHSCGTTMFSLTWPLWALDEQAGIRSEWLEGRIVGACFR
jgi:hypothetical protein